MKGQDAQPRLPVTAAILAGGRSERMGADKTLLPVGGAPLILRVLDVVSSVCEEAFVVTNDPSALAEAALPSGIAVYTDEVPAQGPLGGLTTALANARPGWVLVVAADLPWLSPEVVRALWEVRDGAQVVVPVSDAGKEPLLALYHTDCLAAAREAMASGRRRIVGFFASVPVVEVPLSALREVDPDLGSLVNVNTPEDLLRARESIPSHEEVRHPTVTPAPWRERRLPVERPVTLHLGDTEIATIQASPDDLEDLAVGFMVTEGLLTDQALLEGVTVDHERGLVWVRTSEPVPDDLAYRRRYITAGCGKGVTFASVGHMEGLKQLPEGPAVDSATLYGLMGQLARGAERYRDSGGSHACSIAIGGRTLLVREDVGRHNALDKLLGRAWLDRIETEGAVILTTGRISYEMAVKVAKMGAPIAVSRTAVTDLAARVAEHVGLTLVGYARGGRMVVYTHPERVTSEEER